MLKSLQNINNSTTLLPDVYKVRDEIKLLAVNYQPIRDDVRFIELKIEKAKNEIKELKSLLQTLDKNEEAKKYEKVSLNIKDEEKLIDSLNKQKPQNWASTYKEFNNTLKKETLLKIKYRRSADKGYEDLRNMILDIEDVNQLETLKNKIMMISKLNIETQKDELIKSVEQIEQSLKSINGTYDIINPLSKLKKELKRKSLNIGRIEKIHQKLFQHIISKPHGAKRQKKLI